MQNHTDQFFVLTGGPGSGKTTLIEALAGEGYATAPEAGRNIIQDQMTVGGSALPWGDKALFAELMLAWELRSHHTASRLAGPVFFDRGVPDTLAYLRLSGLSVPAHMEKAAEHFRYNRRVFIAPPWPEIFTQDAERKQDLEEAERTFAALADTYPCYGYELITLPRAPIKERLAFIFEELDS
ncbi:AAA family ATPase [Mesorhizobium sp. 1M-11]|uniref:AAA family ATPase n=1 Tax=Mesorhizobium sp. 1M-11 TaxID=1529006 RepID=UPI0006C75F10|nr:AAA family ATPase [Mesorhizobium sp. 1M-11]